MGETSQMVFEWWAASTTVALIVLARVVWRLETKVLELEGQVRVLGVASAGFDKRFSLIRKAPNGKKAKATTR